MDWIFESLEEKAADDIYSARSWLLVTKCIFPQNFRVLFEAYKLEKYEKNLPQCAALIDDMFRDFPDEYILNKELELMVMKQSNDKDTQQLLSSIFDILKPELQQSILIYVAERQADIESQCKLTLSAIQKLPKDTMKYGLPLTEKLVNEEKMESPNSALNKYRKLLICDVLPVLCDSPVGDLSHKQFYKWLQKTIEFFVAYNTSPAKIVTDAVGKTNLQWSDLETLRSKIGRQCNWEPVPEGKNTITERMKLIKEMHRLSRTDVTGNINKRQIFYTCVLLLLESSIEFSKLLDLSFCNPASRSSSSNTYMVNLQPYVNVDVESCSSLSILKESLLDCFQVARTSWLILQSNESFSKDFNHLLKRWKMDRWIWLQMFLSLHHVLEKDFKSCIARLNRILEQNWDEIYRLVHIRCLSLLASVYYVTNQRPLACRCITECLKKMEANHMLRNFQHSSLESTTFCDIVEGNSLMLMQLNCSHLLPYWIHIFVTSLAQNVRSPSCSDDALGHLIVLSQHEWPKWKEVCGNVLDIISSKTKFSYPIFFDYVVISDILEEISLLHNANGNQSFTLYHGTFNNQQRVTRGVNKGTEEEFNNAITTQMNKGEDDLEDLLVKFILTEEPSIKNCIRTADEYVDQ